MFSDDLLYEKLVLKGGNALRLVHHIGQRESLDVDFSLEDDFEDLDDVRQRVFRVLRDRFDSAGYVVFDERFEPRPPIARRWGGYEAEFKIIERKTYLALGSLDAIRRQANTTGPYQQRTFRVQISKYEFCAGKTETTLDDYSIYVYTPAMIATEKIRAICQQSEAYEVRRNPTPRARDFYDIHSVVTERGLDLSAPETLELCRHIFAAKEVPLSLIGRIHESRAFHSPDWDNVRTSVSGDLREFDFYFDFVVAETQKLESLWIV